MYSVQQSKIDALAIKIRRAKIQAKAQHPDFKAQHPNEARDAGKSNPSYTELENRIKKEYQEHLDKSQQRREKIGRS
jgi:hypothetical protein